MGENEENGEEVTNVTTDPEAGQPAGEEREGNRGCCGCKSADGNNKKDVFKNEDGEFDPNMHPVLDNPDRRFGSLMCCLGSDWPALLIFFAVMGGCFVLWVLAFTKGQVDIALYGMAWNGNVCGVGNTVNAPYQVWINPTVTSSVFATSVCMPACPSINGSQTVAANDTVTLNALTTAISALPDGASKTSAEAAVSTLGSRVDDLKSEVSYMEAQLGDTSAELDRSSMYCLCNAVKFPTFLAYTDNGYDIQSLCNTAPANVNGYIELPYDDHLASFVGDGKNLAVETDAMDTTPCAFKYRSSRTFTRCMPWLSANSLGRITLVMGTSGVSDGVSSAYNAASQRLVSITSDLARGKDILITCASLALVLSIALIYVMSISCFDGTCKLLSFIVWGVLIMLLIILSALTAILVYQFKFYQDRTLVSPQLSTYAEDEQSMYVYGVAMCISGLAALAHLIFICPCVCGENIQNAIEIIAAASEVFEGAWALLFYPIVHTLAVCTAVVCWVIGLVFIATAGDVEANATTGVHSLTYDETFQKAMLYYCFCIIWIVEFMGAVGFMIVCGAILVDFFDHLEENQGESSALLNKDGDAATGEGEGSGSPEFKGKRWPLMSSIKLILCNHMGTAALGSFLITLVVIVRWTLTYLLEEAKAKDTSGVMAYVAACVECLMECVEQCLRYMVQTAYILTVLEGRWFFSAVCGGLYTLFANAGQVLATNYIAFALLWLCKLAVPLGTTTLSYFMLEAGSMGVTKYDLNSTFNILVPVFLISCIFSFTFMNLLGTAIDVVLIAFIKCEEIDKDYPEMKILTKIPKNCARRFENWQADNAANKEKESKEGDETAKTDAENPDESGCC
jgi:hypothetical protein